MEVKPGYKETEVGILPEDWSVKHLKSISSMSGRIGWQGLKQEEFTFNESDPFLITGMNFKDGQIKWNEVYHISEDRYDEAKPIQLRIGDILMTKDGTIGKLLYVKEIPSPGKASLNSHLLVFRPLNNAYAPGFLFYQLGSRKFAEFIELHKSGSTFFGITQEAIGNYPAYLPPIEEQNAIAAALSDVDALIFALDKLIAKKRVIKQAAMQELLTGKKRLPGFSGEWRTRLLGEVIMGCSSGATPYRGRPDYYKGKVKWITSGELNYNKIFDTIEHISEDAVQKTSLKLHPVGTFLMAITGLEAAGTRGACGIVGSPATTNQSCMAIYPTSELKTEYLYHYYVFRGKTLALQYCQGTKQQSYTAKLVRLLPIDMPPTVEEQTAIATVFSDMDAEITVLEARRDKTKALKQGMMQELLTGRIRLVEGGAA